MLETVSEKWQALGIRLERGEKIELVEYSSNIEWTRQYGGQCLELQIPGNGNQSTTYPIRLNRERERERKKKQVGEVWSKSY